MNKNMIGLASLAMIAMQNRNKGGLSRKVGRKPTDFMYDSQYNLYRVAYELREVYEVYPTVLPSGLELDSSLYARGLDHQKNPDGSFKTMVSKYVMASNLRDFQKNPYFLEELQARDLSSMKERLKIQSILTNFDPLLMCIPAALPLVGAPVVWTDEANTGLTYALAGNSRTVAFMNLSDAQYEEYIQTMTRFYPGYTNYMRNPDASVHQKLMLVRKVYNKKGEPLTLREAKVLAANSQGSPAGEQSYLGGLISKARGLSLERGESVTGLYNLTIQNPTPLTMKTLREFEASNPGFNAQLMRIMDSKTRRQTDTSQRTKYEVIVATMLYLFVPDSIVRSGFVSQKEERALIAILPYLGALHQRRRSAEYGASSLLIQYWDLLPYLEPAREFALMTANLSYEDALRAYESMCDENQTTISFQGMSEQQVRPQICALPLTAVVLGLYLKRASGLADPASTAKLFRTYFDDAIESANALFPSSSEVEKEKALDSLMSAVLPKRLATKVNRRLR